MTVHNHTALIELQQLVKSGEGLQLEFKLKTTHPEKIMREAVAFANTLGGTILLGVADNGELKGLKFPDEDHFVMQKSFAGYIYPEVRYTKKEIMLENGRPILAYQIEKSTEQLIYFDSTGEVEDRKVYIRNKDRSIQASKELREILRQQFKNKNYRFQYGEKENILIKYLDNYQQITLKKFSEISKITPKQASRTLILLVLAGVLKIHPAEIEDTYSLNQIEK